MYSVIINGNTKKEEIITNYQSILKRFADLESEIASLQETLRNQPPGTLLSRKNGASTKWYKQTPDGTIYLPKENLSLAKQLAIKKYLTYHLQDLLQEQAALRSYLRKYSHYSNKASSLLSESSNYYPLLSDYYKSSSQELTDWINEPFESNPYHSEQLIHKTFSGRIVRSKSEVLIDNCLHIHRIPFRYEALLTLGTHNIYPDFTIFHPHTHQLFYWEHFGMMDIPEYAHAASIKLDEYLQNGYIPGVNLITTYETRSCPLNVETVEKHVNIFLQ